MLGDKTYEVMDKALRGTITPLLIGVGEEDAAFKDQLETKTDGKVVAKSKKGANAPPPAWYQLVCNNEYDTFEALHKEHKAAIGKLQAAKRARSRKARARPRPCPRAYAADPPARSSALP